MVVFSKKWSVDERYTLELTVTQVSQSVSTNTTRVSYVLKVKYSGESQWGTYALGDLAQPYSVILNGTTVASGTYTYDFRTTSEVTVKTGTYDYKHNPDGSGVLAVKASAKNYTHGTNTLADSFHPDAIPQSSTIESFDDFTIGSQVDISFTLSRANTSFTHTCTLKAGASTLWSATGVTLGRTFRLNVDTVNHLYLNYLKNSTSTTVTLYVQTYSGSTKVGPTISKNAKAKLNPGIYQGANIITTSTIAEASSAVISSGVGVYVQNLSQLKLTIAAQGVAGSTIKKCTMSIDGMTRTITDTSGSWTTGTLPIAGLAVKRKVTFSATDSRGITSTLIREIEVHPYNNPSVLIKRAVRCTAAGVPSFTGTSLLVELEVNAQAIRVGTTELNTGTVAIRTGTIGQTYAQTEIKKNEVVGVTKRTLTYIISDDSYATESSYVLFAVMQDKFKFSIATRNLPTALIPMSWGKKGIAVAGVKQFDVYVLEAYGRSLFQSIIDNRFDGVSGAHRGLRFQDEDESTIGWVAANWISSTDRYIFIGDTATHPQSFVKRPGQAPMVGDKKILHEGDFLASLLSSSGYQKFPSGLILQWGAVVIPSNSAVITFAFPIAFPNAVYTVLGNSTTHPKAFISISDITTTNAKAYAYDSNGGSVGAQVAVRWIAIGR